MVKRKRGIPYIHQATAEKLGSRIRQLRIESGLTQQDLAIETGIDESTVLRIEKARLVITVDLLLRLAVALKVHPKQLFEF